MRVLTPQAPPRTYAHIRVVCQLRKLPYWNAYITRQIDMVKVYSRHLYKKKNFSYEGEQ